MRTDDSNKRQIGGRYEQIAADYLRERGVMILEMNYQSRGGEIDLIGLDGPYLIFVEVKYRKDKRKGDPAEAVTLYKQRHIRKAAQYYLYSHRYREDIACRFDVIRILGTEISWIKDAF